MVKNIRSEDPKTSLVGVRHFQCFLLFWGVAVAFGMRVNLSVAIVAMTDVNDLNQKFTYTWTEKTKSLILSSFFWGYFFSQIPCGQLAHRFGGKYFLLQAIFISGLLTLMTPFFVSIGGWQMLCALRFLQGISQGALHPSAHTLLSKWSPVEERGVLATFSYSGCSFGTVVMLAVSGYLASTPIGWPCIFYVSGSCALIWVVAWSIWGSNSPSDYKGISLEEKELIENSLGQSSRQNASNATLKTPWKKILTSLPVLVLTFQHCAYNWAFWTLLTQTPTYMKHILGLDIKSNALLSSLPYLTMMVLGFVFCWISKMLDNRQCLTINTSRKLFNTISQWIPMVAIVSLGYINPSETSLAVVLLVITIGVNSASLLGFHINHIDLSPNFAGVLMSITNFMANFMSVGAPLMVGFIVNDEKNPAQWRIIFCIAGAFYFVGNLVFILFGTAEVQPWNNPSPTTLEMKSIINRDEYQSVLKETPESWNYFLHINLKI